MYNFKEQIHKRCHTYCSIQTGGSLMQDSMISISVQFPVKISKMIEVVNIIWHFHILKIFKKKNPIIALHPKSRKKKPCFHMVKRNWNSKRHMYFNVHSSIIYNCQGMKASKVSYRWLDKEDVVYAYNELLFSHDKEGDFCHLQQHEWTWWALGLVK